MKRILTAATVALAGLAFAASAHAQQGVTDDTILLGSHTAMSGPLQPWGAASTGAAKIYFAGVNAQGGVHGRQIELLVEDQSYLVPKATEAGRKLVVDDGIFAMLLALGTPHNNAVLPLQGEFNVPNLLPMSAGRSMSVLGGEGIADSFGMLSTYYDQIEASVGHFAAGGANVPCVIYLDTDFGYEILEGVESGAAMAGLEIAATAAHQPGDTDFVGTLTKLAGAGCNAIYLGFSLPGAISVKATAAAMGLPMPIIGSTAIFEEAIILLGAQAGVLEALEGLYAAGSWISMNDAKNPDLNPLHAEAAKFEETFLQVTGAPLVTGAALLGYNAAMTTVAALQAAGPELTADGLVAAMEAIEVPNIFTGELIQFGADGRSGSSAVYLSQIQGGQWSFVEKLRD